MLQAILGAVILVGIYRLMKSGSEYEVDWWIAFAFVLVPGLLIFLVSAGLAFFNLPATLALVGYLLYFLIPFFMLRYQLEFSLKSAIKFAAVVPVVAIATEVLFVLLLSQAAT